MRIFQSKSKKELKMFHQAVSLLGGFLVGAFVLSLTANLAHAGLTVDSNQTACTSGDCPTNSLYPNNTAATTGAANVANLTPTGSNNSGAMYVKRESNGDYSVSTRTNTGNNTVERISAGTVGVASVITDTTNAITINLQSGRAGATLSCPNNGHALGYGPCGF